MCKTVKAGEQNIENALKEIQMSSAQNKKG